MPETPAMRCIVLAAAISLALAFAATPTPGSAKPAAAPAAATLTLSATKKSSRQRSGAAGQIACTPFGCQRIQPDCHPEQGFDFWGNPTGYDIIVCPRR